MSPVLFTFQIYSFHMVSVEIFPSAVMFDPSCNHCCCCNFFTLDAKFNIKDLGMLKYFLGFEVTRSNLGIALHQRKYCLDLLQDTGLFAAKPCFIPMDPTLKLHKSSGVPLFDPTVYRRLVGRLLYLSHTRPDICYVVGKLSQYLQSPIDIHLQAAQHALKYLKGNALEEACFSPLHLSLL